MFRLFALCIFLSVIHSEVSAEELARNGAVPSSNKSQKTNNSQDEFKDNTKTTSQIGKAISAGGELANSTGAKYLGSGLKATSSGLKAINSTSSCADNVNAIDCSDSVKDISNTIKAGSDGVKSLGGKSNPVVSKFNKKINVGSTLVKAQEAYQRGDQKMFREHLSDSVDHLVSIPMGPIKDLADTACEVRSGKRCIQGYLDSRDDVLRDQYNETGCIDYGGMDVCYPGKQKEIRNKRYEEFNNMLVENEKDQAKIRQEAQGDQKQSSPKNDDGAVFFDLVGVVLNGVIDNEVKKAESKQQAQSSGSNCQPKTFNTPDGCHPGHDENSHPGGCHCG